MRIKCNFIIIFVLCSIFWNAKAQTLETKVPVGITYQAVAILEHKGNSIGMGEDYESYLSNKKISVRFSIIPNSPRQNPIYVEKHTTTTDDNGLFNLVIGQGDRISSKKMVDIDWSIGKYFLKVEIAVDKLLSKYNISSIQRIMSVPYALYSKESETTKNIDQMGAKAGEVLKWDGSKWIPSKDLSSHSDLKINTGKILIGDKNNDAKEVQIKGDISLDKDGKVELADNSVTESKIKDGSISLNKLSRMGSLSNQILTWDGPSGWNTKSLFDIYNEITMPKYSIIMSNDKGKVEINSIKGDVTLGKGGVVKLSQKGASDGQVLKWDASSSSWKPSPDLSSSLADNAVTSVKIKDGEVKEADLADNAVTSVKIKDGEVKEADLADDAVTSVKIKDGEVKEADLADDAVTSAKIKDGEVKEADLADNAVTSPKIKDGEVKEADLADDAVTSAKIKDGEVKEADLANDAVTTTKIKDGEVKEADLADDAVTSAKIKDGEVKEADLANDAVTTTKIKDGSITSSKLSRMSANTGQILKWDGSKWKASDDGFALLAPNQVWIGNASGDRVASPFYGDVQLAYDPSVGVALTTITSAAVNSLKIKDGEVKNADLADNAVTSAKIKDGEVKGRDLANDAITEAKIIDGEVTSRKIKKKDIKADRLAEDIIAFRMNIAGIIETINNTIWEVKMVSPGNFLMKEERKQLRLMYMEVSII